MAFKIKFRNIPSMEIQLNSFGMAVWYARMVVLNSMTPSCNERCVGTLTVISIRKTACNG